MHASPCPVCGREIRLRWGSVHDFDCDNGCRSRDIAAWADARAAQLADEITTWLIEHPTTRPR